MSDEVDEVRAMRKALSALAVSPAQMVGFGVERVIRSDSLWAERLAVAGTGRATLATNRSFGDASGAAIGHFETSVPADRVAGLASAAAAVLDGGRPPKLSPADVQIEISVVAGATRWQRSIGGGPQDLRPYQPLLRALNQIAGAALTSPVATLSLGLAFSEPPRASRQRLPVVLQFQNAGSAGYWVRNPFAATEDTDEEHVRIWHAQRQEQLPGVTPLPLEPVPVALEPAVLDHRPLIWIGPHATTTLSFTASLEIEPGPRLFRASFASYAGTDDVGGQPLMRGCVFSNELATEVAR